MRISCVSTSVGFFSKKSPQPVQPISAKIEAIRIFNDTIFFFSILRYIFTYFSSVKFLFNPLWDYLFF